MLLLRSLLFNAVMITTAAVYATLVVFTFPLDHLTRYRVIRQWARFIVRLLRWVCGLDFRVEGREHLPDRPAVILSKHQSAWETIAFQEIFPPQVWVLKRELLWVPFFGWGLALTRPIAIDRAASRRALDAIVKQGIERLNAGRWVVVFPEGTRMAPGQRGTYGPGGALLASRSGAPVVPVAHNAGEYWPRRGWIKRPGTIRVVIGPAIEPQGKSAKQINREAEAWIESKMAEIGSRTQDGAFTTETYRAQR